MQDILKLRVYYADTDAEGIVYHGAYINFYDRGRTEFFRKLGIEHKNLNETHQVFVIKKMSLDYFIPGFLDEILCIKTEVSEVKGARILITQSISNEEGKTINRSDVTLVLFDIIKKKPAKIPSDMVNKVN